MKRLAALSMFTVLIWVALATPARAQTGQSPCSQIPSQWEPGVPVPAVADLVATHACLLAHYNSSDPSTDYGVMTADLEQTGIGKLIAAPEGLPKLQRVQVLNDYAFWQLQRWVHQGEDDRMLVSSISVLKLVLSLTPERGFAWLNLGDVYRAEMNDPSIPGANQYVPQTPRTQAAEAKLAVAAYRRYLALVHRPSQRVVDYVAFESAPNPSAAAAWNTNDAIANMAEYPAAASFVLSSDNSHLATMALAMDIGLLLPNAAAHKDMVNTLLQDISTPSPVSNNIGSGFDGTAGSFIPYLTLNGMANRVVEQFPLPCGMIIKFPVLLDATAATWGGSGDALNAVVNCADPKYQLPPSIQAYESSLSSVSGFGSICGTISTDINMGVNYDNHVAQLAPTALLPPYGLQGMPEISSIENFKIPPNALPLQAWGETDLDSYAKAKSIDKQFLKARSDLATYYQTSFGLPPAAAAFAAQRGIWMIEDGLDWASKGTRDPLAEALLANAPLAEIKADLAKESPVPAAMLFIAVRYPEALKMLLAQNPDLTVTTPIGKTVLMEAAKYNQLESVKLLLAAGGDVDAASFTPDQISNNSFFDGTSVCGDIYYITHGSRTALMYAAANASLPVITTLLAAGADPAAKDSTGATALDYLEGRGPVAKNPVLNAADFKTAALDLSGKRWKIPPPRKPKKVNPPQPQSPAAEANPPHPKLPQPTAPSSAPRVPEYLHPYKPGETAL